MALQSEVKVTIAQSDAPFAPEEELGEYLIRRWTWREKQQAMLNATKILDEKRGLGQVNVVDYEIQMMLTCIREKPEKLELTAERFDQIDADVGSIIMANLRKVNGTSTLEKQDFLGQSEPEEPEDTPG